MKPDAKPLAPPRPCGRFRRAAMLRRERAAKAAAPYLLVYGISLAAALLFGLIAGPPFVLSLPCLILGAALAHAGIRLHEARGWHRSGGKAAMRKRRRFQGHATVGELHRKLGLGAARRNAAVMRPSLGGRTRALPAAEAGVFIGTARRWHR